MRFRGGRELAQGGKILSRADKMPFRGDGIRFLGEGMPFQDGMRPGSISRCMDSTVFSVHSAMRLLCCV